MQTVPDNEDVYEWLEGRIASGEGIAHAILHRGAVMLAIPVIPELSEGSLIQDIGFRLSEDGKMWTRCKICRGIGRVDCCEESDCQRCRGLFTAWCTHCSAGLLQIAIDKAEREYAQSF